MFGYVTVNQKELKFKEFDIYHAYYCGLCRMLGKKYGLTGRFSLTYDCTFLILFLSGLYEPDEEQLKEKCPLHMIKGTCMKHNIFT